MHAMMQPQKENDIKSKCIPINGKYQKDEYFPNGQYLFHNFIIHIQVPSEENIN